MKLKSLMMAATGAILLLTTVSCKKDNDGSGGGLRADDLPAGKGVIEFKTSRDFGGLTYFKTNMTDLSVVTTNTMAGTDLYTITAFRQEGTSFGQAQFTMNVSPLGANTSAGSLTGAFGGSGGVIGTLLINNGSLGSTNSFAGVDGGNITITKLTDEVIEGTFSCTVENNTTMQTMDVTEGKFAARF
ncbi:MAG TPA: hypothetical protein PKY29_06950 [Ferruginibacter sp.]|nr:hypothetical protein [Ferruginibacter sp.]HRN80008.1 hypothetical protein [Ferruginibacter sp.]HRO17476.1 hypothetical protein [Ferruginibacter sp.]HRQ21035.1 hypothetical protein [Ferruginibacter sp.]